MEPEGIVVKGVDNGGVLIFAQTRNMPVALVYMTVDKESRTVGTQERGKAFEAPVRQGLEIVDMARRRMGDEDIDAAHFPCFESESSETPPHGALGIHIFPLTVAETAAQPHDLQAVDLDDLSVDTDTALGLARIFVVISVNIEKGTVCHRHEELEIADLEIAAGDDQVDVFQPAGPVVFIEEIRLNVGDREDSHYDSVMMSSRSGAGELAMINETM